MVRIASGILLLSFWGILIGGTFMGEDRTPTNRLSSVVTFSFLFGAPGSWLLYDGIGARRRQRRVLELAMLDYRDYQEIDTLLIAQQVKISPVIARQIVTQGIVQGLIPHDTKIK